jgi:hypothetical protein
MSMGSMLSSRIKLIATMLVKQPRDYERRSSVKPPAHLCMLFEQFGSSRITAVVRVAATRATAYNGLKRYPEPRDVDIDGAEHFDRSRFRRTVSMAVSSSEQDQNECQIECQSHAREGLSRACECSRGLLFFEVSAVYLQ